MKKILISAFLLLSFVTSSFADKERRVIRLFTRYHINSDGTYTVSITCLGPFGICFRIIEKEDDVRLLLPSQPGGTYPISSYETVEIPASEKMEVNGFLKYFGASENLGKDDYEQTTYQIVISPK